MTDPVSVIVPARNEAQTIARVVSVLADMPDLAEVVVIDNGSTDATAELARRAGATVVSEARAGMGYAVRAGIAAARHDWVMKVD
ncbi:MAG: glycosyltransferase family 2 protein, partial [Roseovarius sp.]